MESATPPHWTAAAVTERMRTAINQHDLEALAACFAPDYLSEFPSHPDRAFQGHQQMRTNWMQIFGMVPDIQAVVVSQAVSGDHVWAEWEWTGTRRDGGPFAMRGVTISRVEQDRIA